MDNGIIYNQKEYLDVEVVWVTSKNAGFKCIKQQMWFWTERAMTLGAETMSEYLWCK